MLSGAGRTRPRRRTATYRDANDCHPERKDCCKQSLILPFDAACKCDWDSIGSNISHRKTCVFAVVLFCTFGFPRHQELPPDEPPQGHICYHFLTLIIQYPLPQCWEVFLKPDMPCGESLSGFRPILFELHSSKMYSHIPHISHIYGNTYWYPHISTYNLARQPFDPGFSAHLGTL